MIDANTRLGLMTLDALDTIEEMMLRHKPTNQAVAICMWCERPWPCPDWKGAKVLLDQLHLHNPDYEAEGEG